MKRASTSTKGSKKPVHEMDIDEDVSLDKKGLKNGSNQSFDPALLRSTQDNGLESDSSEMDVNLDEEGGDSEEMSSGEVESEDESISEESKKMLQQVTGDDNSSSESEESDDAEDDKPQIILNKAQKLLRAAVEEEIEKLMLFPPKTSTTYDRAINEAGILKEHLKNLKSQLGSMEETEIVWKSSHQNRASKSSQAPEFEAYPFLQNQFSDHSQVEQLLEDVKQELEVQIDSNKKSSEAASNSHSIFTWTPPQKVNVVGSYILGTSMVNREQKGGKTMKNAIYSIDISVTLPESMFKHKDIKGHRYEYKRLLYLGLLSKYLEAFLTPEQQLCFSTDEVDELSTPHLQYKFFLYRNMDLIDDDTQKKSKKRKTSGSESSDFVLINIRPVLTMDTFKLSQLLPWKPQLTYTASMPSDNEKELYETLKKCSKNRLTSKDDSAAQVVAKSLRRMELRHNEAILKDIMMEKHTEQLRSEIIRTKHLNEAIVLSQRWLAPRRLLYPFNAYVISMIYSHLLHTVILNTSMDALDLFKGFLRWIAKGKLTKLAELERLKSENHNIPSSASRDIHTIPPVFVMSSNKETSNTDKSSSTFKSAFNGHSEEFLKSQFAEVYPTLLLDRTGYVNVFSKVSKAAWEKLENEAAISCGILEKPDSTTFDSLFHASLTFCHAKSHVALNDLPPLQSEYDITITADTMVESKLHLPRPDSSAPIVIHHKSQPSTPSKIPSKGSKKTVNITTVGIDQTMALVVDKEQSKIANETFDLLKKSFVSTNHFDTLTLQLYLLQEIFNTALATRVEHWVLSSQLRYTDGTPCSLNRYTNKSLSSTRWLVNEPIPTRVSFTFGLSLQATQWQRLLEYGPHAQKDVEVAEFVKLWGKDVAGLRKFKDGQILYCVAWNTSTTPSERHRLPLRVIEHLVNRHLKVLAAEWKVSMLGDDVLFELLKAPQLVLAEIKSSSMKTTPAPTSIVECHDHLNFAWIHLQKMLRGLRGLPLPIKSLSLPGPVVRGTEALPPIYNPLADPEVANNLRQNALRTAPASALCPNAIPVIISFEGSGSWPDDLEAISHVKTAFYIQLSQSLTEQQQNISSRVLPDALLIFFKGYIFKLEIFYPRELTLRTNLHKQVIMTQRREEQEAKFKAKLAKAAARRNPEIAPIDVSAHGGNAMVAPIDTKVDPLPEVLMSIAKYDLSPKVATLLRSLNLAYPAFGPTCVLFKKWMASHLIPLSEYADGLLIDLLVARVFQTSHRLSSLWLSPPHHAYSGFYRVLYLISLMDWESGPLVIPLEEEGESNTSHGSLGWTCERFDAVHFKWQSTPEHIRSLFTVAFSDGSAIINPFSGNVEQPSSSTEAAPSNDDEIQDLNPSTFEKKIPGVAFLGYGTPSATIEAGIDGSFKNWQVDRFTARATLNRLKKLAAQSSNVLGQSLIQDSQIAPAAFHSALTTILQPTLLDFDICVEFKKSLLTRTTSQNLDEKKRNKGGKGLIPGTALLEPPAEVIQQVLTASTALTSQSASTTPPLLVGFDPVAKYLEKVHQKFGDRCLLFHDAQGGPLVGLIWKPSSFNLFGNISYNNVADALPLAANNGHREGSVPNIFQIMNQLLTLGEGLVQQVHLVAGQNKLR